LSGLGTGHSHAISLGKAHGGDALLCANVHVKIVSEMLSHSSVSFTLDRYSHVIPTIQEEAARVMDEVT
jgi:hypothetical protein